MRVDNAIIMAAGIASRFAPLSYRIPKALLEVRGEILIERQIEQLVAAGIPEIIVITGYMAEKFEYLRDKFGVRLINNPEYLQRNNNSSIYVARKHLKNSYICSADNYFMHNPFEKEVDASYYSAVYIDGETSEWCIEERDGIIANVTVGGHDSWVMMGHVFWAEEFSQKFREILEHEYNKTDTADKMWETIYIEHISELPMKIRKYPPGYIFEFDTMVDLQKFDLSYV